MVVPPACEEGETTWVVLNDMESEGADVGTVVGEVTGFIIATGAGTLVTAGLKEFCANGSADCVNENGS